MTNLPRKIAVFGPTGSIGRSAGEVARHSRGALQIVALSAHRRLQELATQAQELLSCYVVATDAAAARQIHSTDLARQTRHVGRAAGLDAIERPVAIDVLP